MGRYSHLLAPLFADFCGVEEGQRLLDVGCGPGAFTAVAADRLGPGSVVAVDPSPSFVAACRQRYPDVDVRAGAAEALPVDDASFDRAVAQLVIHFVTDPARSVAEMTRAPYGPAVLVGVCVWDGTDGMGLLHVVSQARAGGRAARRASRRPAPSASEGELGALLAGAGLDDVERGAARRHRRATPGSTELWGSLLEGHRPRRGVRRLARDPRPGSATGQALFDHRRPARRRVHAVARTARRGVVPA